MDEGRTADLKEIDHVLATSKDKVLRGNALRAGEKIKREQSSGYLRDIRERLLAERKAGRNENVKDISEDLIKKRGQEERHTFFFSVPWKK